MVLHSQSVTILTDAAGDAEDYTGKITGKILAVHYDGNLAANADFEITGETTGLEIITITNAAASAASWLPRILPHKHTDGTAFTDAAAEPPRAYGERLKIVTADGGNADTGVITIYYEEEAYTA